MSKKTLSKIISRYGSFNLKSYQHGITNVSSPKWNVKKHWTNYEIDQFKIEYSHLQDNDNMYPPSIQINGNHAFDWVYLYHNVDLMMSRGPVGIVPQSNLKELIKIQGGDDVFNILNLFHHEYGFSLNWQNKTIKKV
jgi:hypothetical protein